EYAAAVATAALQFACDCATGSTALIVATAGWIDRDCGAGSGFSANVSCVFGATGFGAIGNLLFTWASGTCSGFFSVRRMGSKIDLIPGMFSSKPSGLIFATNSAAPQAAVASMTAAATAA